MSKLLLDRGTVELDPDTLSSLQMWVWPAGYQRVGNEVLENLSLSGVHGRAYGVDQSVWRIMY